MADPLRFSDFGHYSSRILDSESIFFDRAWFLVVLLRGSRVAGENVASQAPKRILGQPHLFIMLTQNTRQDSDIHLCYTSQVCSTLEKTETNSWRPDDLSAFGSSVYTNIYIDSEPQVRDQIITWNR